MILQLPTFGPHVTATSYTAGVAMWRRKCWHTSGVILAALGLRAANDVSEAPLLGFFLLVGEAAPAVGE